MIMLKGKKILLIITGGIACYKSLDLIRRLQDQKMEIECILTESAKEFVKPLAFESLIGKKTHSNLFSLDQEKKMTHINLAKDCHAILVIPCTANFLGKIANGVADDLASNVLMASNLKKIVAPAMNSNMWGNLAVKKNIKTLQNMGITVLKPQSGRLACGTQGAGKLMEIEEIVNKVILSLSLNDKLRNLKAVVTCGPSIEKIDPVRFLSNFSSGLQGIEIAKSLVNFGADTTLICGPVNSEIPNSIKVIKVESGKDFLTSTLLHLPCDIFISVAAISDWRLKKISKDKIKKDSKKELTLKFTKNFDVLKSVCSNKNRPKLVIGFSAETKNIVENSKKKLGEKKCDWLIANKVSENEGFKSKTNKVFFINKNNVNPWPKMGKDKVAKKLSKKIVSFFKNNKL
tara:strand:+ start:193 stop:1401 length:1209 start_codon:yes stop_codon:yes gene_type:complete